MSDNSLETLARFYGDYASLEEGVKKRKRCEGRKVAEVGEVKGKESSRSVCQDMPRTIEPF